MRVESVFVRPLERHNDDQPLLRYPSELGDGRPEIEDMLKGMRANDRIERLAAERQGLDVGILPNDALDTLRLTIDNEIDPGEIEPVGAASFPDVVQQKSGPATHSTDFSRQYIVDNPG